MALRPHLFRIFVHNNLIHFPIIGNIHNISMSLTGRKKQNVSCNNKAQTAINSKEIVQPLNCLQSSANNEPSLLLSTLPYKLFGLQNSDRVSCYANASLQSLMHCSSIRQQFQDHPEKNYLNSIFQGYLKRCKINIMHLRIFANKDFVKREQQDVAEFITYLCDKSNNLKSILKHEIETEMKCLKCAKVNILNPYDNYILPLHIPLNRRNISLQDIINHNFDQWKETDVVCNNCHSNKVAKIQIRTSNKIVILQLKLFIVNIVNNDYTITKINDLLLKNVHDNLITINNKNYKVINAVLHYGNSTCSGHYINMLRDDDNRWIEVDDFRHRQSKELKILCSDRYLNHN